MRINFTKMHGCGNDYIYIDCLSSPPPDDVAALSRAMSLRRFSVGADGVILILPSSVADAKMRIFNADGSEGKMCGNGIRCVGKYLWDVRKMNKPELSIETLSGVKRLVAKEENGSVSLVGVDMGRAELLSSKIPIISPLDKVVFSHVEIGGETFVITCVSMGNPHAVMFNSDVENADIEHVGRLFEQSEFFPEGINVELCRLDGDNAITMRVWERGSGETLACGTGACAAAVASVLGGTCKYGEPIKVRLPGGELYVTVSERLDVFMLGGAEIVYNGVYDYEYTDK